MFEGTSYLNCEPTTVGQFINCYKFLLFYFVLETPMHTSYFSSSQSSRGGNSHSQVNTGAEAAALAKNRLGDYPTRSPKVVGKQTATDLPSRDKSDIFYIFVREALSSFCKTEIRQGLLQLGITSGVTYLVHDHHVLPWSVVIITTRHPVCYNTWSRGKGGKWSKKLS